MRPYLMIFAACLLASCTEQASTLVPIVPVVPSELRTQVVVPERVVNSLADVGVVLADHVQALDKANGQISATDCILTRAEQGLKAGAC